MPCYNCFHLKMQASLFIIDCIDIYFYSRYYIEDLSMISFMAGNGGLVH